MWNSSTENNAAWPGKPMTEIGDNVWSYTPNKAYKNVIFSSGSNKSNDLTVGSGDLYNNKTNTWSVYDTSDIQVTSYKADPSNTIYTGTAVTLSTTANSLVNATISYQISVNDKVVSPMSSANSYVWTPSAVENIQSSLSILIQRATQTSVHSHLLLQMTQHSLSLLLKM